MIRGVAAIAAIAAADAGHAKLPGVFGTLEPTLHHYGYFAVFGLLFLENLGIPLPGETILIAAALYAAQGQLNIVLVGVVAVLGSVLGSCAGYAIGSRGGRPLAERYGRYVRLTPDKLDRIEAFFARRGWLVVIVGRFIEGVRQAAGIIAGFSEMTVERFLLWTTLGAVAWVAVWCTLGEVAGNHVETISKYATYIAIGLAVVVVLELVRRARHKRKERTAA